MDTICIYHNADLDGLTSAAIVSLFFKSQCAFYGIDYGDEVDIDRIKQYDQIYIVDIRLERDHIIDLLKSGKKIVWIDHHKDSNLIVSSIREEGIDTFNLLFVYDNMAACKLAFSYLFIDEPIPESVLLIADYDTYSKYGSIEWSERILPYQYGARSLVHSVDEALSIIVNQALPISTLIDIGRYIIQYEKSEVPSLMMKTAKVIYINGIPICTVNYPKINTLHFERFPIKSPVYLGYYIRSDGKVYVSLRSVDKSIKVRDIAVRMGGGGHDYAAGFILNSISDLEKFLNNG